MSEYQPRSAGRAIPYSDAELFQYGPPGPVSGEFLNEIAFPLGGIGSGCVSLSGRGQLVDWEIFNRPNKGYRPDNTYFMLHAKQAGCEPTFRVLEGRLQPPYQGWSHGAQQFKGFGFGPPREFGSGFLRFPGCRFTGQFPFASLELWDEPGTPGKPGPSVPCPLTVRVDAWSPFVPLDAANSSFPVAVFDITLTNPTSLPVDACVALGLQNIVGWPELGESLNEWVEGDGWRGINMTTCRHDPDSARFGSLALLTPNEDVTWQLRFAESTWFAQTEGLMDGFGKTGRFDGPREPLVSGANEAHTAHLGLRATVAPGQSVTRTFVLSWLMPNFEKYWGEAQGATWKTWQGAQWKDALQAGAQVMQDLPELESRTRAFHRAFFSSTLPTYVLDAISSQISILRTPTVTRLTDGTLYGWEGCHASAGCCEGSCTHVWSYAQAIAHVFPELERGMRQVDYAYDLRAEDGHMQFRMSLPPGTPANNAWHAAADGQMGNVLRTFREWQLCGDENWLRSLWPSVKKALEYAWVDWDADRDGLLEGVHHNTLDIEYHGPETVCGSMYLAALRAGEEMARAMGDEDSAAEYRRVFELGSRLSDETLYDGEYYVQRIPEGSQAWYQYGPGCICDQVLGQWHARQYGLGDLYDPDHVRSAIASVFRHNFRDHFHDHHNPHRVYALGDDRGLLICTWPKGGRPEHSVTYAFECMIGFEYQVGAHLVYEGFLREGLSVCKAIRDRHDGRLRNPFNEFECGSHYARSMSNYSYLPALAGMRYSAVDKTLWLDPVISREDFRVFIAADSGWGTVSLRRAPYGDVVTVDVIEGELDIQQLVLSGREIALPGEQPAVGGSLEVRLPGDA